MLTESLRKAVSKQQAQHLWRKRHVLAKRTADRVQIDNQSLINFCSNDYLNLSTHPDVIKSYVEGAQTFGLGSGASAIVSGCYTAHTQLEEAFADFLQRDRALLFNSGYHANLAVLSTFANRSTTIVADKLCHASLLDGIQLSRAKHIRYQHNNHEHAAALLAAQQKHTLLVTESVFSMRGNVIAADKLATLAQQTKALLVIDDAHGIGVLGRRGAGICDHYQLSQHDVPCLIVPLGKAIGSMGAIVAGNEEFIETLLQFARTYRYSTALPPAVCFATLTALKILMQESWRRTHLEALSLFFISEATKRQLPLASLDVTPIKPILIGDNQMTCELHTRLTELGFFVSCIRPPTVPKNQACLRISLNCAHTETQIIDLLDAIAENYAALHSKRA